MGDSDQRKRFSVGPIIRAVRLIVEKLVAVLAQRVRRAEDDQRAASLRPPTVEQLLGESDADKQRAIELNETRRVAREIAFSDLKKTDRLPSPGATVLKIMQLVQEGTRDATDLRELVESDPALVATLLKYVNAAWKRPVDRIDSIDVAIARIGQEKLSTLALGFWLGSKFRTGDCVGFDYDSYWAESSLRATAARFFIDPSGKDVAFTAGLLSQIGRLAFATAIPHQYTALLKSPGASHVDALLELERTTFGIDHCELAAEMVGDWGMSEYVRQAILFQRDQTILDPMTREYKLADVLRMTSLIWDICEAPSSIARSNLARVIELANQRRLQCVSDAFDDIVEEWKDVSSWFGVTTPSVPSWGVIYGAGAQSDETGRRDQSEIL